MTVRADDPATSHAAIGAGDVNALEAQVLRVLGAEERGGGTGLTTVEIAYVAGVGRDSISPRMRNLHARGFVVEKGKRASFTGKRKCIVWALSPRGKGGQ